jgi:hypothetical protein
MEPRLVIMNGTTARRSAAALALMLLGSVAGTLPAAALQPRESSKDTAAAASFYREAVKGDPRNAELLERAFVSLLADGAMTDAFRAAERLATREGSNGLAQLALGVRQLKAGQYGPARQSFARSGKGAAADLTATLLTAWAYAGAGDGKRANETLNRLRGERYFNVFRDSRRASVAPISRSMPIASSRRRCRVTRWWWMPWTSSRPASRCRR